MRWGVGVVRLNALSVVFVGLASAAFPIHAEQTFVLQSSGEHAELRMQAAVALPDFVPVVNYDQFLLASRGDAFASEPVISPAARMAAEALSAKFAAPSPGSARSAFQIAADQDPLNPQSLDAVTDPKRHLAMAERSASSGVADPEKVESVRLDAASVATKSNSRRAMRTPRRHVVSHLHAKRANTRQVRERVASSAMPGRSGAAYNGIGADLERLVGFGSLSPDHRLAN